MNYEKILTRAARREALTEDEALALWERAPLQELAGMADEVRREVLTEAKREVVRESKPEEPEAKQRVEREAGCLDAAGSGGARQGQGQANPVCTDHGDAREKYVNPAGVADRFNRCNAREEQAAYGAVADPEVVTWQIDRNVNITNVCISGCKFCNFHCRPAETGKAYVLTVEDYIPRIEQTLALGGDQLLLQGGLHPGLGIEFYTGLFSELKRLFPSLKLHALGAPEVAHIARISGITVRETLERLVVAGLDSLPGAGAEILVDEVRRAISPGKPSVREWLDVMREAHRMNLPTSATMMYGHVETPRHIVQHLIAIRDLQAERPEGAHGFVAFIPWIFRSAGTVLEREGVPGRFPPVENRFSPLEYLRVIALSRLVLNNIRNIQASWLTVGKATAQMALHSGANDMGSIMIEENVVSSAGADNRFDAEGIQAAIREAGFRPQLRDQLYRVRDYATISTRLPSGSSTPLS